uniref:FHA domain-containing protein n=1 Tax=Globisporangium ultimum (strain ATCC 200006 / CBS 805.95 / DAOM BR144) TaxID=431595 RepID=K3WPU2_GLOUD
MWVLDVMNTASSAVENTFYLVAGEWSIGRKKCHFNFQADSSISRSHALLCVGTLPLEQLKDTATRPSLVLVDQNSRFGSFVNQEQCFTERELKNGDQITFGAKKTILRVRYQVFILVASRIQRTSRARVNETCQRIGMHLIASESKDATHCIMDPGKIVATVKVLWALVYNQPVVCTPWIYAILKRKSLSEPLPRCEDYLPIDELMPSITNKYLPNPMRKTLFSRHVVVFLIPQSMEEIIAEMAGVVISAYKDTSDHDDLLLRGIEQHASSRHVLIVEPTQASGFSSAAASSDGRDHLQSGAAVCSHAIVERRVSLFRSIGAAFVTIQELAASVLFVKTPSTSNELSFSNSLAGHNSSSVQIMSFPEHLSLYPPSAEPESDEAAEETSTLVKEENTRTPTPNVLVARITTTAAAPRPHDKIVNLRAARREPESIPSDHIQQVKEENVESDVSVVKEELPVMASSQDHERVYLNASQRAGEGHSHPFSATNVLSLEPFAKRESECGSGSALARGWVSTLSSTPHQSQNHYKAEEEDEEPEHKPVVVSCNLIVKRPVPAIRFHGNGAGGVNFKRFKKGNGYGARSNTASLFPQQMVVSVTVDNADRVALEENLEVLEEQERIADELFAMAENRNSRRRF